MYRYYITKRTNGGLLDFPPQPVPKDIHSYGDNGLTFPHIGQVWGYAEYDTALSAELLLEHSVVEGSIPVYHTINEETARRAKEMMSFDDYTYGHATEDYRRMVDKASVIANWHKREIDPMYHKKVDSLMEAYSQRFADNMNHSYRIGTMCPSILIAGSSNFPVKKKERQNAAAARNMEEFNDIQGLLDKIRSIGTGGVSADDPNAIEKLKTQLRQREKEQETMKAVNAFYRKNRTVRGCPAISAETAEKIEIAMGQSWRSSPKPFESYVLTNNNASIRRIKARIEELERKQSTPSPEGWKFDGGEVIFNKELNRIQIIFDGKPDEEVRSDLKSRGFRWAPSQGAWQRQDTPNARYALRQIKCVQPND